MKIARTIKGLWTRQGSNDSSMAVRRIVLAQSIPALTLTNCGRYFPVDVITIIDLLRHSLLATLMSTIALSPFGVIATKHKNFQQNWQKISSVAHDHTTWDVNQ